MKPKSINSNSAKKALEVQRKAISSSPGLKKLVSDYIQEKKWSDVRDEKLKQLVKQCLELGCEVKVILDDDHDGLLCYRFDNISGMGLMNNTLSLSCEDWEYEVFNADVKDYVAKKEAARLREEARSLI